MFVAVVVDQERRVSLCDKIAKAVCFLEWECSPSEKEGAFKDEFKATKVWVEQIHFKL